MNNLKGMLCAFLISLFSLSITVESIPNQVQGLYIFTDSKPKNDFKYLGTVKSTGTFGNPQYENVRDRLIKQAKKEFPKGNGLIIDLRTGQADKADVILIE